MLSEKEVKKAFQCFCGKTIPEKGFLKNQGKDKIRLEVCQNLPLHGEVDGNEYCVLHYPSSNKPDISHIITQRLNKKEYNFGGVWFPQKVNFHEYKFQKDAIAHFDYAHFSYNTDFWFAEFPEKVFFDFSIFEREALFSFARFQVGSFHNVTFMGEAIFYNTRFKEAGLFTSSYFKKDASFGFSKFRNALFSDSEFSVEKDSKLDFFNSEVQEVCAFDEVSFPAYTNFSESVFGDNVLFAGSEFNETYFSSVEFKKDVFFSGSTFQKDILFDKTKFNKNVDFTQTNFLGTTKFTGDLDNKVFSRNQIVSFDGSFVENPERMYFHTVTLYPSWFINLDARKLIFQDVDWEHASGTLDDVKKELDSLKHQEFSGRTNRLLTITSRHLAENAENNNRFEDASKFRRMAFEIEWIEKKEKRKEWIADLGKLIRQEILCSKFISEFNIQSRKIIAHFREFSLDISSSLYRFTSHYGESWTRAAFVLLMAVLIVFPIIYMFTQFQVSPKSIPLEVMVLNKCEITDEERKIGKDELVKESKDVCHNIEQRGLRFFNGEAILHSLTAITFQDVEYRKPISSYAEFWTIFEKILAPLQAALLALAIRRKFMR